MSKKQAREEFRGKSMDLKCYLEMNGNGLRFKQLMKDFDQAISQTRKEAVEVLEEILREGHGGGNWRRLINLKLNSLKKG